MQKNSFDFGKTSLNVTLDHLIQAMLHFRVHHRETKINCRGGAGKIPSPHCGIFSTSLTNVLGPHRPKCAPQNCLPTSQEHPNSNPCKAPGVSLTEKKKVFRYQFSQKSPRALHVLNHGWWQLAVGGWRLAAVGGWQLATGGWWRLVVVGGGWWLAVGGWRRLAVVGSWRLVAAGGWRRLVAGGWWWLVVGGWWRLAVDGSWRLAVGGPLGRSLRAVLSKKKKSRPLRTPLQSTQTAKHCISTSFEGLQHALGKVQRQCALLHQGRIPTTCNILLHPSPLKI